MTLQTQWLALASMVASGLLLGILFDLYRVLKGQWKITGWIVALVDLCYWILAAGWVFSVLLWSTWGELRFYMLVALFVGVGIYYLWLSRGAIVVILFFIRIIHACFRLLFEVLRLFIWTPMIYIGSACWAIATFILRAFAWLLSPLWRLVHPLLKPVYEPTYRSTLRFFRYAGGVWRKIEKRLPWKK